MAIGGVVINFAARTADAVRDVNRLDNALGGLRGTAKKAGGGIGAVLSGVGKAIPVVGAGLVAAAGGFAVMAKSAYDDAKAQEKLERNLRRVAGTTKKAAKATGSWIDQMELATLISDDDLRVALSRLAAVTGDLADAQKLAKLAQDAAVGSGKEFTTVAEAMAKAAGGNTAALKKQFPELKAGSDGVLTLAEALDQLKDKYGGAAKAAADQDVFGRIRVAFGQIGEAIGSAALPLLEDLSAWFADKANISKIEDWIGKLQTWATDIGEKVVTKVQEFFDWLKSPEGQAAFDRFKENLDTIAGAAQAAVDVLQKLKDLWDWYTGANNQGRAENPKDFFDSRGGGNAPDAPGSHLSPDQGRAKKPPIPRNAAANYTGDGTVVNIYNPKPERASTSIASTLRITRPNTVSI